MVDRTAALGLVVAVAIAGCGTAPSGPRHLVLEASSAVGYPCVLHDPAGWPENFIVRQSIELRSSHGHGQLDAVMQKRGDTLLVIGLGPMSTRLFTLAQRGQRVDFEQAAGPELPFSPRNILVDVHRVFFKALPHPPGEVSGVLHGYLDGEAVEETWENGQLRRRSFTRPGTGFHGAVRVEYGDGCRGDRCQPGEVTVFNEWFDYTLTIANNDYEMLD